MKERRLTAAVLTRFRQELLRRERSAPTIEKYLHDVRTFAVWLDGREVTPEAVLAWKRELVDQFKPGTVNGKLAAVNALFAFAGWPDCQARSLKVQRRAFRDNARELTKEEFYRLVATAERLGKDRLALLFEAIGSTGVRVSEVKYFTVEAARLGRAEIALKGKIRTILLPGKLCRKLLYLFFHLAKHFKGAGVGLRQILDMMQFQKAYGGHIQWDTVRRAVEGLHSEALYGDVDAIGLCFGFTPHKLFPESHPEALLADSLDGGVYGRNSPTRNYSFNVTSSALSRNSGKGNLFWLLFPPASHIIAGWPELKDHPKRLPIVWVKRIFRFLFVRRGGKVSLSALRKGKERVSLLRLYGLLPGDRSRQKER